jgi:hypothetical protein
MLTFEIIKTIISDCICKTARILDKNISNTVLNLLANEYTDKIMKEIENEKIKNN